MAEEKTQSVKEIAIASFEMGQEKGALDGKRDLATDLQTRIKNAVGTLTIQAGAATDPHEQIRLSGKADGMKVALSYVEEVLRG